MNAKRVPVTALDMKIKTLEKFDEVED